MNPSHGRFVGEAVTLRNIPMRVDLDRLDGFRDPEHPQRKAIESVRARCCSSTAGVTSAPPRAGTS